MVDSLRVILRSAEVEETHVWSLSATGAVVQDEWTAEHIPGRCRIALGNAGAGPGSWTFQLSADTAWSEDVTAEIQVGLQADDVPSHVLWPRFEGRIERCRLDKGGKAEFRSAGRPGQRLTDDARLALPFAVLETPRGLWLAGADPSFSTTITFTEATSDPTLSFSWRWLAAAGVHADEKRGFFIQSVRSVESALNRWFELATPEVPKGPDWLHDIALQDYDFLSKDGHGWYRDIDAACEMIAPEDRHRALFCLHGWYDRVGRYCFDPASGQLDDQWVAFPYMQRPELLALVTAQPVGSGLPTPAAYAFRNVDRYRPVDLSWDDLRARLRYARERGFRTAVYVMTGMQDAGERAPFVANGTGLDVETALWQGPELIGATYLRNPLHPDVRTQTLAYVRALLERVGDLADAMVMDESYYIGYGVLGPPTCPGYADRAQMNLVKDMTNLCHQVRPDLAFMTADLLGAPGLEGRAFPYSLYADGIYQDSWCWPQTWDCVRLPAWRNVAWSCNWAPVTNLAFTRWAVLAHHAPVAISNGCFGDDTGLADMDATTARAISDLWRASIGHDRTKRIIVADGWRADAL